MKTKKVATPEILKGYDAVSSLYPYIPSLSHWRAWEYAAYRHYSLNGRILDLGCGDGRYFNLLWPRATNVIGVDINPHVVEISRKSGVYKTVHLSHAHQIPEYKSSFDHVFANCSLEHMDNLDAVSAEIHRCLKPGGTLLCSVVTDHFVNWFLLPKLFTIAGHEEAANITKTDFFEYHHLVNPLSVERWMQNFEKVGLSVEEHTPILPKYNTGVFLLIDSLWHAKKGAGGEIGDDMFHFLSENPNFPMAFKNILFGLMEMETDWEKCGGAVFLARKL